MENSRKDAQYCKETTILEKNHETLLMFQTETGFHAHSWFTVSG